MSKLKFFRQKRVDGGIRTGIVIDDNAIFEHFEEGEAEHDPTLLWFVDLRCEGDSLPQSPRAARNWFLKHQQTIRDGFQTCAEELRAGIDISEWPWSWSNFTAAPPAVAMKIVLSTIRRVDGIEIAAVLKDIAVHWEECVKGLKLTQSSRQR